MPYPVRNTPCSARDADARLRTAHAYLVAAELTLGEDGDEYAGVAAGNAVLAGIAAADALCCKGLGRRSRGDDHRQAAELLATVSPAGNELKNKLSRLLDLKDEAHYGFGDVSRTKAMSALRLASSLVASADALVHG